MDFCERQMYKKIINEKPGNQTAQTTRVYIGRTTDILEASGIGVW